MKVSEIGEFGLIELLAEILSREGEKQPLLVGIGDDAAAWQSDGSTLLATTDTLVQGVHFNFSPECTWRELGWKALAVNLSDIGAMGGVPQYALLSLSLPKDTEVEGVIQFYHGMAEIANQFKVAIAGGNITSSPLVVITLALIGKASKGILTRGLALPGELIAVTSYLGSAAGGLRALTRHLEFEPETVTFLKKAFLQPQPRVAEGQLLVDYGVKAAIDISDGLIADLTHVCQASKVGAIIRIDQIPVHPSLRAAFKDEYLNLALTGGEDYELLFTASPEVINKVKKDAGCPITVIGEVVEGPGQVTLLDEEGKPMNWDKKGWDHFASGNY